jgi:exosortase A
MTTQTMAPSIRGQIQQSFRLTVPVLVVGLLLFGVLFHTEVAAAVGVWSDSTAYNHCFLVIPIVAYLLWDRRDRLALAMPIPNAWFALAAIPVSIVWLLAERLGIMEGRQLMVMTLVEIFFLSVLGWRLYYLLAGPLLYLYFMVPFGAFITPALQGFTTSFIVNGLNLLSIPNYSDGYAIEIPEGSFLVAEACAGLRFLIASIAFGCLYAMLMYRSPLRRGVFILISIIVPIIANGFRALGIVVVGHIIGNAEAATADHLIYGWLFFSVVILLQIALGLPFRQDHRPLPVPMPAPAAPAVARTMPGRQTLGRETSGRETSIRPGTGGVRGVRRRSQPWYQRVASVLEGHWSTFAQQAAMVQSRPATLWGLGSAAAAAVVIAATGPAAAIVLNRGATADFPATVQPIGFTGACIADPNRPTERSDGVGRLWVEHLKCGQSAFTFRLEVFPPRTRPSAIISEFHDLSGGPGGETTTIVYLATPEGPRTWRIQEVSDPATTIAGSLWIDGRPTQVTFDMRMHRAWASVFGSNYAPVAISLTPELDWSKPSVALRNRARDLISLFVQTYQSLPDEIVKLSYAAAH